MTSATAARRGGERRLATRVLDLLSLQHGEVARAFLTFTYLFLVIAAYLLIKAIRNALFISEFGALKLPYVMLGIALLTGVLVAVYIRLARSIPTARLTVYTLVFFTGNVLLFWWLAILEWKWLCPILYVWSGMFGVIATTQVWTLANDLFTVREAKRVFGVVGSGGIVGAAIGGSLAFRLAPRIGTPNLLLVVAALLVLSAVSVVAVVRLRPAQTRASRMAAAPKNLRESVRIISRSSHLRLLAGLVFVTALATTTVDFQFNVVASEKIVGRDALTAFFGAVYGSTSVIAFVLQIAFTSRFLAHLGVGTSLLLLPFSLLSGTSALVMAKTVWAGVLLKGSDGALKHSLDRSCRELLYLPVSPHVKVQTKSTIDTVLDRAGDGTAGAVQLAIVEGLSLGLHASLALNFVMIGCWLVLAVRLKRRYVDELRLALGRPETQGGAFEALQEDKDARRTLERILERGSETERLAALEWATRARVSLDERLLLKLARAEAGPAVRRAALASLLGGSDADLPAEALERLEEEGQHALVAAIDVVVEEDRAKVRERLEQLAGEDDPTRLPLLAYAVRRLGPEFEPFAVRMFDAILAPDAPPHARRAAVASLGLLPGDSPLVDRLEGLLDDDDPEVAAAAAAVAARRGRDDLLPKLVALLARPRARAAAREAIVSFGAAASDVAIAALEDGGAPDAVRRRIPGLLADLGTPRAVESLVRALRDPDPLVAERSLDALRTMRRREPDVPLPRAGSFEPEVLERARRAADAASTRDALAADGSPEPLGPLVDALGLLQRRSLDAVFGLLALEYDPADMERIGKAVRAGTAAERSTGFELLANVLPRPLERKLLPLLEGRPAGPDGHPAPSGGAVDRAAIVGSLVSSRDPWVAATAVHAARRLGLEVSREAAAGALASRDAVVREEAEAWMREGARGAGR